MRLSITYKSGGAFTVEANDEEDLVWLYNMAQRILWGKNADAMTLDEMDEWLGWSR